MGNVSVTVRIDEELKKEADGLFADLGMNLATAFTVFLRQAVREQQIPFQIRKMFSMTIPKKQWKPPKKAQTCTVLLTI